MKRLTMRSSSEWKLTTTSRPPGLRIRSAANKRPRQLAKLIVDEDAQRLEHARRRVDLVARLASDMGLDCVGKVERAFEGPLLPARLDHAGDTSGMALFAQEIEDPGQIARLEGVDDVGSVDARLRHAHVERTVMPEGKAALRFIELHRGDADVEHDAIRRVDMIGHGRERRLNEPEEPGASSCSRAAVASAEGSRSKATTRAPARSSARL